MSLCLKRLTVMVGILIISITAGFAQTISDKVTKSADGEGTVIIYQAAYLKALLDGTEYPPRVIEKPKPIVVPLDTIADKTEKEEAPKKYVNPNPVKKIKIGYRVQIYSGNNSRGAREKAYAAGRMFKGSYTNIPVYVHFVTPHWTCSVGNFQNLEDARRFLAQIKSSGRFRTANVVRTRITVKE